MFGLNATRRSKHAARLGARRSVFLAAIGVLCLVMTGCGEGYKAAPVSGTVTVDGRALPGVTVSFQPVAEANSTPGPGSVGKTDANGRYTLQLTTEAKKEGAVVGKHRVTLTTAPPQQDPSDDRPQKYTDVIPPGERGQARDFTVPAGGTDKADFQLSSKRPVPLQQRPDTGS